MDTNQLRANGSSTIRRAIHKAVLRYLRWRALSQLQHVDPHMSKDFGVDTETILSIINRIEIGRTT
jgi:hypothetical protein